MRLVLLVNGFLKINWQQKRIIFANFAAERFLFHTGRIVSTLHNLLKHNFVCKKCQIFSLHTGIYKYIKSSSSYYTDRDTP